MKRGARRDKREKSDRKVERERKEKKKKSSRKVTNELAEQPQQPDEMEGTINKTALYRELDQNGPYTRNLMGNIEPECLLNFYRIT